MDAEQRQDEGDLVHLHVMEVVEEELGRQQDGQDERKARPGPIGKRALDDVPGQVDRHDPEPEVEEGEQHRGHRQGEQGQGGEYQRGERGVLERPRPRQVAVVERRAGGEIPPGLPEDMEILADVLVKTLGYRQGQAHDERPKG